MLAGCALLRHFLYQFHDDGVILDCLHCLRLNFLRGIVSNVVAVVKVEEVKFLIVKSVHI